MKADMFTLDMSLSKRKRQKIARRLIRIVHLLKYYTEKYHPIMIIFQDENGKTCTIGLAPNSAELMAKMKDIVDLPSGYTLPESRKKDMMFQ